MIKTGLTNHTYPLSQFLLFSSTFAFPYSLSFFHQIPYPSIFLFNTLISSIITHHKNQIHIAFSLYDHILTHNSLRPNCFTFPSLFKACGFQPWFPHGRALHTHVLKFLEFPDCDHFVLASMLNFYAKFGNLGVARYLFNQIRNPDLASWNSILTAYARSDDDSMCLEVLCLFNEMQSCLIMPNEITIVALIVACADLGALMEGVWAHVYVLKNHNLVLNRFIVTALIGMYSKCGCLELAHQVFDEMPERDILCYNAMIGGCAIHGYGHQALQLYEELKSEGLVPDDVTFVVTMCACSHVGLVEQGCKVFESIKEVYGFDQKLEHYGCLVDLLGRAGRVKEAMERVKTMPMKPNAIIWRALLGAARVHGDMETGETALRHLMELEPENSGSYVVLSNMYADSGKWDEVKRVRKLMKDHGVEKNQGSSLVEIDGAMDEFLHGAMLELNQRNGI